MTSRLTPKLRLVLAAFTLAVLGMVLAARPSVPSARGADAGSLRLQIRSARSRAAQLQGAAHLTAAQLAHLHSSIAALQERISRLQVRLLSERDTLLALRRQLDQARVRLAALQRFQAHAESVLAAQLISTYESDRPDIINVVLDARGFSDLLERLSFAQRIRQQDVQVTTSVKRARRAVALQAVRLGALELRQQTLTDQSLQQRNQLERDQLTLVGQQLALARAHAGQERRLGSARAAVASLQGQLAQLQAQAAARAAAARAAAAQRAAALQGSSGSSGSAASGTPAPSSGPAPAAPVASSGGFVFPLPVSAAAPPGAWSPDQGVDISAPGNTPEYAVCSGTIVLHGIGGFGPWAPVLHCDSPLDGYSYVYYGHAGPENQLPVGSHVGAGQVMSSIGPGIVGISSGPHLEIGFCDSSGTPLGSGTAGTMMALLRGAY